ncbi:unnamed protein product [Prorocentrum cordatum]|uniref:1,3-beta-glucan synthase n=1 Tax=Prorocentrum cordatum TaxID=2364126 RepID=A0ABN9X987_9DINO|nr:unnamed protein product [Polarella glacialis]
MGDGRWMCLTPDMEITQHNLNELRHYVLDRNAQFPRWVLAGLYAFDPIDPGELLELKRQARQRAALLGAGDPEDEADLAWVIAEPQDARFGEVVLEDVVEKPNRCAHLRRKGMVMLDGQERIIELISRDERDDWMKERKESCVDIRLNGDQRTKIGRRGVDFRDAVDQMEQVELADYTDLGPRAMGEFITSVAVGSGNLTSYQAEWERMSGVLSGGAQCHEHRSLLEIARRAICMGQLNVKNLHCMEALVRCTEFAVARQKDRANILKQMRLHKEELDRERPSDDGGKRNQKDKEKDEGKKKKGAAQRSVLESVQERIDFYGKPSSEAVDGERSLRGILRSTDQYELEPQHLASYDVTRLRVCKGDISPVLVTDLLRAEAAGFLRHFQSQIELSEPEIAERVREIGIVGFRRAIKPRCGAFFAHKKDGNIRFMCDARATNMCRRLPPRTVLGGAACLSEIDLSSYATALGGFGGVCEPRFSGADVKDCFYQLANEEMGSWFGFDSALTVEGWDLGITRARGDDVGGWTPARAGELLFPCLRVLPMGWAWALYFAQEAVAHQVRRSTADGDRQLLRDKRPAPLLRPGRPLAAVHVDNFTGVGGSAADAELGARAFEERAAEAGLALRAADVAVEELESLGLVLCGADRRVRQKPKRVWRFYFATKALLRRGRATGAEPRVWAGHAVALLGLQPCLLSILQDVHVSDSSSSGSCLMYGRKPLRAVWDAYRWRERWRFVEVEADGNSDAYTAAYLNQPRGVTDGFGATLDEGAHKHADARVRAGQPAGAWRETELGQLLFRRAAVGRGAPRRWAGRPSQTQEVELLNVVPALPTALASDPGWTAAVEGRWKYDEHINVKEGRAAAYSVGCRVRWRVRHVPTDLNVADEGSRRDQARDPEWLLQKKRERQPLFAGAAGLTAAMRHAGLRTAAPFDIKKGAEYDLSRRKTQLLPGTVDFETRRVEVGRQTINAKDADENMVHWFAQMFFDGMGPGTGRNGLFGWILLRGGPFQEGRQLLPRARRQLKAWGRTDPSLVGLPYPLILIWAIALDLLNHSLVRTAACAVLQTDLYSRPSKTLELSEADILRSQPAAGRAFPGRWAVVFAPSESGRRTKTGQTDDTVDVGVRGREWVRDVVAALKDSAQAGERAEFKASLVMLKLQAVGGSPHWLRHSGPSNDRFEKKADLPSIQKRGRWVSFKSSISDDGSTFLPTRAGSKQSHEHLVKSFTGVGGMVQWLGDRWAHKQHIVVTGFDADKFSSSMVFLAVRGTIVSNWVLWAEQALCMLLYLVYACIHKLLFYREDAAESRGSFKDEVRRLSSSVSYLAAFLLSFYTSLTVARWWRLRTDGIGNIWASCSELCLFISEFVTDDEKVLTSIRRYARASLVMRFLERRFPGKLAEHLYLLVNLNVLTEEEVSKLREYENNLAESIWTWVARIVRNLDIKSDALLNFILKKVAKGRAGAALIGAQMATPIPLPYVHLLGLLVKLHNYCLAVCTGYLLAVDSEKWPELTVIVFFVPFLYNSLLLINAELADPFDGGVNDFPMERYELAMESDGRSYLQAGRHTPEWMRLS